MKYLESGERPYMRIWFKGGWAITRHVSLVDKVMADFKRLDANGYVRQLLPWHPEARDGWIPEHRVVAERKLGRFLCPGECVHHIDGDKANNDAANLMVFPSSAAHLRHHGRERRVAA